MAAAGNRWFRAARILAAIMFVSLLATLLLLYFAVAAPAGEKASYPPTANAVAPNAAEPLPPPAPLAPAPPSDLPLYAFLVSTGAFLVSTIGTASTVILGWRNERRQAAESQLRVAELEAQIAESRRQGGPPRS
jgi:hypothetical protein